jgi:hypothetical protein
MLWFAEVSMFCPNVIKKDTFLLVIFICISIVATATLVFVYKKIRLVQNWYLVKILLFGLGVGKNQNKMDKK